MSVAACAEDFDTAHAVAVIHAVPEVFVIVRLGVAGPAGAGIELIFALEEGEVATDAVVGAVAFAFEVDAAEGGFGAVVAEDAVLLGVEALLPFFVGEDEFVFAFGGGFSDGESGSGVDT